MFLRKPQRETAIGNLADYEAYHKLCLLALSIERGPPTGPIVAAMLASGSC